MGTQQGGRSAVCHIENGTKVAKVAEQGYRRVPQIEAKTSARLKGKFAKEVFVASGKHTKMMVQPLKQT
jgi:hypothetical protein